MKKFNDYLTIGPRKIQGESDGDCSMREANYDFFMDIFGGKYLVVRDKIRTCLEKVRGLGKLLK